MIGFAILLLLTLTFGVYFGHLYEVTGMIIAVGISQVLINIYYWAYAKIKFKVNAVLCGNMELVGHIEKDWQHQVSCVLKVKRLRRAWEVLCYLTIAGVVMVAI